MLLNPHSFPKALCWGAVVVATMSGCNAILENDPRSLDIDEQGVGNDGSAPDVGWQNGSGDASAEPPNGGEQPDGNGASNESGQAGATGGGSDMGGAAGDMGGAAGQPPETSLDGSARDAGSRDASEVDEASAGPCALSSRICSAGEKVSDQLACGSCGTGKATRTRTCLASCTWGPWSAAGACQSAEQCVRGTSETRSVGCSCGGSKGQSRVCSNTCAWGAWSDTNSCDVSCCAELVYCDTPNNLSGVPASRGTWCRQTSAACSHAEAMSDCLGILGSVGCTLHQTLYIDYL